MLVLGSLPPRLFGGNGGLKTSFSLLVSIIVQILVLTRLTYKIKNEQQRREIQIALMLINVMSNGFFHASNPQPRSQARACMPIGNGRTSQKVVPRMPRPGQLAGPAVQCDCVSWFSGTGLTDTDARGLGVKIGE